MDDLAQNKGKEMWVQGKRRLKAQSINAINEYNKMKREMTTIKRQITTPTNNLAWDGTVEVQRHRKQ